MTQVIEIDTSLIDARINNRDFETAENMRHVASVAESIKAIGQKQPVILKALANGRYQIIAGETRTRACASLEIKVLAIVESGTSEEDDHTLMLVENDGRKNTNDIEKARGYQYHCNTFGLSPAELAKKLGKRVDFVQDRLDLLTLCDDIQHLVKIGGDKGLKITYALKMVGLDKNRQDIAIRYLNANPSPTPLWFQTVCEELRAQQNQPGLFVWGYGEDAAGAASPVVVKMPPDPANYRPSFNPGDMRGSVMAELEKWQAAGEEWKAYGKFNKVESCQVLVAMLTAVLAALPAVSPASSGDGQAQKVLDLIGREGGETTRRVLLQFGNFKAAELTETLDNLERSGRIVSRKSGRGERWAIVA